MNTKKYKQPEELLLLPRLLDCQIMDKNGVRCGKVDDIAIEGKPGQKLIATNIIVGVGNWHKRKRDIFSRLFVWFIPHTTPRQLPLAKIKRVDPLIELICSKEEIYISSLEKKITSVLSHIPGGK